MLRNRTSYGAERSWVRDANGNHLWIVAVKASFAFDDAGNVTLHDEQTSPHFVAKYFGERGRSSIRYEADMVPPKPTTDILLNASAHAPHGREVRAVHVSLRVGDVQKRLVVHGPRIYEKGLGGGLAASEAQPFVSSPIIYEWAFGGTDLSDPDPRRQVLAANNPIGRGVTQSTTALSGQQAHRIEYLDAGTSTRHPNALGSA